MKVYLGKFKATDLYDTGSRTDPQDPAISIKIGDNELMTERYLQ